MFFSTFLYQRGLQAIEKAVFLKLDQESCRGTGTHMDTIEAGLASTGARDPRSNADLASRKLSLNTSRHSLGAVPQSPFPRSDLAGCGETHREVIGSLPNGSLRSQTDA